jgi:membrane protein implicated in regulation of membrane protease activity
MRFARTGLGKTHGWPVNAEIDTVAHVRRHDVSVAFWAWICITVLLALGEAVTGGLLVLPWAIGAGVAAALEAMHADPDWQWLAFLGVSVVLFLAAQRLIVRRK